MNITILQFPHEHVAHNSYLLADPATGTAAVIDPYHSLGPYLLAADSLSANIRHIFVTKQHDDFPGGHRELQKRTGATLYAGAWTRPPFDFLPVKTGDVLEFGQVRLKVLETPGHRLEAISVLVYDLLSRTNAPYAAFTGDTLFLGGVGLPEPQPEDVYSRAELADFLYESIQQKLLALPDSTRLYPAQGASAFGEPGGGSGIESLMSFQKLHNPALQKMSSRDFCTRVLAGMTRTFIPTKESGSVRLRPVSPTELMRAGRSGAQLVDLRSPADYAASHLEQTLNVPLDSAFEPWVGAILDRGEPVLLVAPPGREREAAARLEAAGFAHVAGFLKGGMQALEERPQLLRSERPFSLLSLEEALRDPAPPQLLEIGRSHGPTSGLRIPIEDLGKSLDQLSRQQEIAVCAETPFRTSAAASYLRSRGFPRVRTLSGGLALWRRRPQDRAASLNNA